MLGQLPLLLSMNFFKYTSSNNEMCSQQKKKIMILIRYPNDIQGFVQKNRIFIKSCCSMCKSPIKHRYNLKGFYLRNKPILFP